MQPLKKQDLFIITGASGVGKSSACELLFQKETDYIVMESDLLWRKEFNTPENQYQDYRSLWMNVCANISQIGMPVVLCGCGIPEQFEEREERKLFGTIYYIAVVADDEELERRMREGRKITEEEWIQSSKSFNQWLKKNGNTVTPLITLVDGTHLTVEETAAQLDAIIHTYVQDVAAVTKECFRKRVF